MTASLYGCHNRPPFRSVMPAQAGWYMDGHTRTPHMVSVRHQNTTDCQYRHSQLGKADPKCDGCKWRDA